MLKHRCCGLLFGAATLLLSACAQPPAATAPGPHTSASAQQSQTMATYAYTMERTMRSDRALARILTSYRITTQLGIYLLVEPNGFVDKGAIRRSTVSDAAGKAIIHHLINVNFGPFLPGMPHRKLIFGVRIPVPTAELQADGGTAPAFQQSQIVLYQPTAQMAQRLGHDEHNSAVRLGTYIRQLEETEAALLDTVPPHPGADIALVMGVKPGLKSRAWVVARDHTLPTALIARIKAVAEAVPAIPVHGGPIAFALVFKVWGGGTPITTPTNPVPFPRQWIAAAGHGTKIPDGLFARIWH